MHTSLRTVPELNPLMEPNVLQNSPSEAVKFLFDSEDLLETGISIQNPNKNLGVAERYIGLLKLNLSVLDLDQIIAKFSDLACTEPQFGIDDGHPILGAKFCAARHEEGEALLQLGSMLEARQYARRGCPPALRARVWRKAFGLNYEVLPCEEQVRAISVPSANVVLRLCK
jgi:hypothetical protein